MEQKPKNTDGVVINRLKGQFKLTIYSGGKVAYKSPKFCDNEEQLIELFNIYIKQLQKIVNVYAEKFDSLKMQERESLHQRFLKERDSDVVIEYESDDVFTWGKE